LNTVDEANLHWWSLVYLAAMWLVAIGVLLEGTEILARRLAKKPRKHKKPQTPAWVHDCGDIGLCILVAALIVENIAHVRMSEISEREQRRLTGELTSATKILITLEEQQGKTAASLTKIDPNNMWVNRLSALVKFKAEGQLTSTNRLMRLIAYDRNMNMIISLFTTNAPNIMLLKGTLGNPRIVPIEGAEQEYYAYFNSTEFNPTRNRPDISVASRSKIHRFQIIAEFVDNNAKINEGSVELVINDLFRLRATIKPQISSKPDLGDSRHCVMWATDVKDVPLNP
jgi:hypothetical protein